MKRLHVHLGVADLDASIRFYSTLFGTEPSRVESGYARWRLDEPAVNFAISQGCELGVGHLGIQAGDADELADAYAKVAATGAPTLDEGDTTCCFAHSTKQWVQDPDGIAWEVFQTHGEAEAFGSPAPAFEEPPAPAPTAPAGGGCC